MFPSQALRPGKWYSPGRSKNRAPEKNPIEGHPDNEHRAQSQPVPTEGRGLADPAHLRLGAEQP